MLLKAWVTSAHQSFANNFIGTTVNRDAMTVSMEAANFAIPIGILRQIGFNISREFIVFKISLESKI